MFMTEKKITNLLKILGALMKHQKKISILIKNGIRTQISTSQKNFSLVEIRKKQLFPFFNYYNKN